jgi:hypothetical protein
MTVGCWSKDFEIFKKFRFAKVWFGENKKTEAQPSFNLHQNIYNEVSANIAVF